MKSRLLRAGLVVALAVFAMPAVAFAQYNSPNYEVDEIFIGGGGELDACGTDYCADQSVGGTGGSASSDNYGFESGFGTPGEPAIEVTVTNTNIDLGVLNTSGTSAASANFSVASYLTQGYIVRILGSTPTNVSGNTSHSLSALNAPNPSEAGTEQFGINLVANSYPGIGANPVQEPDDTFAYGEPAVGYDQEDNFKYVDGDIIAESTQATGKTSYTMSIIANIANSTPGGQFKTVLVVQAIATF